MPKPEDLVRRRAADEVEDDDASLLPGGLPAFLRFFFTESSLRPVLIVLLAHGVLFAAVILVYALRDRSIASAVALAAMVFLSLDWIVRDVGARSFGLASRVISGVWAVGAIVAVAAARTGLL